MASIVPWRRGLAGALGLMAFCPATSAGRMDALDWHKAVTQPDRNRLRDWRGAWMEALGQVRSGGAAGQIAAQGVLFDPDHALDAPIPPAGAYQCRVFKLGGEALGVRDYAVSGWGRCAIAARENGVAFEREEGTQRPAGVIFADTDSRAIFLGTLALGDETRPIPYGRDGARNMAGIVERVGEKRWRIALPRPSFESCLDVIELVPA